MKDREAPFSPNYVHLRSHDITRFFFYLQKLWNFNFSRNIMQTEYMAPMQLSRFVYMNAIAFKCIFSQYDQKSVSRLFIAILLHSVVEYSLNQFPCRRHVFL